VYAEPDDLRTTATVIDTSAQRAESAIRTAPVQELIHIL
jgi:hypothetical protein